MEKENLSELNLQEVDFKELTMAASILTDMGVDAWMSEGGQKEVLKAMIHHHRKMSKLTEPQQVDYITKGEVSAV